MNDPTLRAVLKQTILAPYIGQADTVILEELSLWNGESRVDLALVNGIMHGFEIKSERDTLNRLPQQALIYNSIFDQITLVVAQRHLERSLDIVPDWWGVEVAQNIEGELTLETLRTPQSNPRIQPLYVAQLLWREEALSLLEEFNAAKGYRSKPRHILHQRLVEVASLEEISARVRYQFKTRIDWRSQSLQPSSAG